MSHFLIAMLSVIILIVIMLYCNANLIVAIMSDVTPKRMRLVKRHIKVKVKSLFQAFLEKKLNE